MNAHAPAVPGPLARYLLLGVTVLGTMSNNIINVPLRTIADDFDQPISTAVLSVSAFILVLAVAMPITGWLGDRFGPKTVLVLALLLMVAGQIAAALAPNLGFLIGMRAVQGLACSAIPPMVMGMLVVFFPGERLRMMGAWAAANGVGQAIGPPVGGLISDVLGWRAIFAIMALASLLVLLGIARTVPHLEGRHSRLHLLGALLLSTGTALLLVALTALSLAAVPQGISGLVALLGIILLGGFLLVSRNNDRAMIPPHLIIESRFLRSSVAAFAQMFTLGTVLVLMPLYLTGTLALSLSQAGILFFVLPLTMALMAPVVSRLSNRASPRLVLRSGLVIIIAGGLGTGALIDGRSDPSVLVPVSALLAALGVGMAMVQTPAAAGATRSPAGSRGAAIGLFNMLRFSGSTAGTAWVALVYPLDDLLLLFAGCAAIASLGLALSFVGPDPA
ncbi:MFS transporter [Nocardioides salarius]|uniref:MFS transporter n=1 Tax=Nocardioides salarius TaxID=374513 RepID=UPI0030FC6794